MQGAKSVRPDPRSTAAVAVLLILVSMAGLTPLSGAVSPEPTGAQLPSGRYATSAVWDGEAAYVFGGYADGVYYHQIVRFDPVTNTAGFVAGLPITGRMATSAAWDGEHAYVFGGFGPSSLPRRDLDHVVRYDPETNQATLMDAKLPTPRYFTSAVSDGQYAYIFGGQTGFGTRLDEIVRYDPVTDTTTVMDARLPVAVDGTSATWDGRYAYIFGGMTSSFVRQDQIVRYDPTSDTVTVMDGKLPTGRTFTAATWDGQHAHIIGGHDNSGIKRPEVLRYDVDADTVIVDGFMTGRNIPSFVWDGTENAYAFGGESDGGTYLSEILRFPINQAPVALVEALPAKECEAGGRSVTLDGSDSHDPDGPGPVYSWSAPGVVFDDEASPTPTGFFPLGTTSATLVVRDVYGATDSASTPVTVVDTLPPTTTHELTGTSGDSSWWRSPVDVALMPDDLCGPVAATEHAVNGARFETGTSFTIEQDGVHTIEYFSTDGVGNVEAVRTHTVRVDQTPPEVTLVDPVAGDLYVNDVEDVLAPPLPETVVVGEKTVRAEVTEQTSGLVRVEFRVDGDLRHVATDSPFEFVWDAGSEAAGLHELSVVALDAAGNEGSDSLAVRTVPTTVEGLQATCGSLVEDGPCS